MIKIILISTLVLTLIGSFLFTFILFKAWNKNNFDKIMSSASLGWAIFSIIITCLISLFSIKESKVVISFTDGRYMDSNEEISLVMNDDKSLDMNYSPDFLWAVTVNNYGNKAIDKIRIKITFDNLYFSDINDEYELADGKYAFGGYSSLIYETDNWIPPQQKIVIPLIDFTDAYIDDVNKDVYMNIYTYTEEDSVSEFRYKILINS